MDYKAWFRYSIEKMKTFIMQENFDVDVVVLGGGIVGLSFANLLAAQTDYAILLVEPQAPCLTWDAASYDLRVSSISRSSQNLLRDLGVWSDILQQRVGRYGDMLVWDSITGAEIAFKAASFGEADLGHIIENRVIHSALWYKLKQHNNVMVVKARAQQMLPQDNSQQLILTTTVGNSEKELDKFRPQSQAHAKLESSALTEVTINTKLVVGADGANSWLRQYQRIGVTILDTDHHSLVATVVTTKPHDNIARQIFIGATSNLAASILAFLPLADPHVSSIVWSCSPEYAETLLNLTEADFCLQLEQAFAATLGAVKLVGKRASFSIKSLHANSYLGQRTVLIGDAAHVVHPLAGQGLNLGLQDAALLVNLLRQYGLGKTNVGSRKVLRKYERARRSDNLLMLKTCLVLKELFAAGSPLLQKLRGTGLQLVDQMVWLKQILARKAMGY